MKRLGLDNITCDLTNLHFDNPSDVYAEMV